MEVNMKYPSVLRRYLSGIIDFLVVFSMCILVFRSPIGSMESPILFIVVLVIFSYEPVLTSTHCTLGQWVMRYRVREFETLKKIHIALAIVRYIFKIILGTFSLFTVSSDKYKRSIHDKIAYTVVINVNDALTKSSILPQSCSTLGTTGLIVSLRGWMFTPARKTMGIKTAFRLIILLNVVCVFLSVSIGISFVDALPPELQIYLSEVENEEITTLELILGVSYLLLSILTIIAIWLFKFWGRTLFVILTIASFPLYFEFGNVIMLPWEAMFSDISFILEGMILAMMFSGSISEEFRKDKPSS